MRVINTMACLATFVSAAALAGCGGGDDGQTLHCYVGGTMRPAMEELAKLYEQETGRKVALDYGDSGANMIKAETSRQGDLYVGHDPFHGALDRKGLLIDAWPVATLEPMITVAKGNPKKIAGLKDLTAPGLKVILTDAMYSTAGHIVRVMAAKAGITEALEKNVVTRTRTGGEAANAVVLGNADAAICWNAVIFLRRDKLDAVPIEPAYQPDPAVDTVTTATFGPIDMSRILVTVDLLKSTRNEKAARAFAELAASPRGREVWSKFGFGPAPEGLRLPVTGAATTAAPDAATASAKAAGGSLLVYTGAGLRPAMEELAQAFTAETGTRIESDYGGSGMIISRLRLARRGDLFWPGDEWYVDLAAKEDLVASKTMICYFVPVILVRKGNPKNVRTLADLARPGLRLGLGDPRACQVGRTCDELIAKNRLDRAAIEKNLAFSSTTVSELGLQIQTGGLDAAIVWDAVAAQYADSADVVPIPPQQNVIAHVAIGVLKCSQNRDAAEAFVKFLLGDRGREILRKHQYRTEPPSS